MHNSKLMSILGVIVAVLGALSSPQLTHILPPAAAPYIATAGVIAGALMAALGKGALAPSKEPPNGQSAEPAQRGPANP